MRQQRCSKRSSPSSAGARIASQNSQFGHMALRQSTRSCLRIDSKPPTASRVCARRYASVGSTTFVGQPPSSPAPPNFSPFTSAPESALSLSSTFDARILSELRQHVASSSRPAAGSSSSSSGSTTAHTNLHELIEQYLDRSGHVLGSSLPYESRPAQDRKTAFDAENGSSPVVMIVHVVQQGVEHRITQCSGFALSAPGMPDGQTVFVTCAHTLEEIRHHPLVRASTPTSKTVFPGISGSFVISGTPVTPTFSPVSSVLSALHRSDLILLSTRSSTRSPPSASHPPLRTLPVSPYPAQPGTPIRAHFVSDRPPTAGAEGWRPWVGGTFSKWVRGTVLGYRDLAGREAKPGTYDALSHLLFDPPPTPGSSGGPIVDEESGAVIGVMLGTQMQNRLEGTRGWGVPSEMIFEMFSLPGLKLKNRS
ncbi:hypothetical protein AcV7_000468 [Taiwanofungus camphoratus]|nr:hypothetical protein AcV7_000468 [Antrodia cinnamomea]